MSARPLLGTKTSTPRPRTMLQSERCQRERARSLCGERYENPPDTCKARCVTNTAPARRMIRVSSLRRLCNLRCRTRRSASVRRKDRRSGVILLWRLHLRSSQARARCWSPDGFCPEKLCLFWRFTIRSTRSWWLTRRNAAWQGEGTAYAPVPSDGNIKGAIIPQSLQINSGVRSRSPYDAGRLHRQCECCCVCCEPCPLGGRAGGRAGASEHGTCSTQCAVAHSAYSCICFRWVLGTPPTASSSSTRCWATPPSAYHTVITHRRRCLWSLWQQPAIFPPGAGGAFDCGARGSAGGTKPGGMRASR